MSFRIAIAASLVALVIAGPAAAQKNWSIGTSSTGSEPYVGGVVMANAVNRAQTKLRVSAQTTGGYNENLVLVASGRLNMGQNTILDLEDAYLGRNKFATMPNKEMLKDLRAAFIYGGAAFHFVTRADSGIRTFADLKGRKVNLNTPATFTRGFNERLLKVLGIGMNDIQVFSISTGKHFEALQDRVIDVGFHNYALHLAGLEQLAATTPVHLLSLPDGAFDKLNAEFNGLLKSYTIPAGTYRGQTEPSHTVFVSSVLYVHKDADADDVYTFTKAFWQEIDNMAKENAGFIGMTPQLGKYPGQMPVHPGSARFFEEKGIK
jgi:TRAP transporter TAXI family solute receptor